MSILATEPVAPVGAGGSSKRVVVVGGGLAGLAAAVELAGAGAHVTIVDRNEHLGGKMNVLEDSGFTFDMGPTIITLPEVLKGIIERAGQRPEDMIDLVRLDPQWRCFYEDGTVIDLREDVKTMAAALDKQFPADKPGASYSKFIDHSRRMLRLSEEVFFYRDVGSIRDVMKVSKTYDKKVLSDVLRMRLHSSVAGTAHGFIREPHLRQLVEHFLQYVGSSPFLAPSILSLIASAQVDRGCWYPMGGTRQVARTLVRLAESLGIEAITGVGVSRITHNGSSATGVELDDGRRIEADAVVSNCDAQRTMRDLLPDLPNAKRELGSIRSKYTPACSGLVLYLGLDRQYDHLAHHCFLFSGDSRQEFDDIYKSGIPARDPTLYLAVPSRTDPGQAPPGGEALYILVHTAYRRDHQRWDGPGGMLEQYRPVVIDKLKRFGMEDIEDHIVVEHALTPDAIEQRYNAEGGAIYGLASHGKLKGGFKPRNTSPVLDGLFMAGGSANPGPGVPMVLMSGVTAARAAADSLSLTHAGA